jgi:hypothetical protein
MQLYIVAAPSNLTQLYIIELYNGISWKKEEEEKMYSPRIHFPVSYIESIPVAAPRTSQVKVELFSRKRAKGMGNEHARDQSSFW